MPPRPASAPTRRATLPIPGRSSARPCWRSGRSTTTPRRSRSSPWSRRPPATRSRWWPCAVSGNSRSPRRPSPTGSTRRSPGRSRAGGCPGWPPTGHGWSAPPSPRCEATSRRRPVCAPRTEWPTAGRWPVRSAPSTPSTSTAPSRRSRAHGRPPAPGGCRLPTARSRWTGSPRPATSGTWPPMRPWRAAGATCSPSGPPRRSGSSWTGGRSPSGAPGRDGRPRSRSWRSTSGRAPTASW